MSKISKGLGFYRSQKAHKSVAFSSANTYTPWSHSFGIVKM
jgi:hypothetical protein